MIDISCSNCARNNQDVSAFISSSPPTTKTKEYTQQYSHQQQQTTTSSSSEPTPTHANYQYLTPSSSSSSSWSTSNGAAGGGGTTSVPSSINFQPKLNYFNHNHLQHQSLIAPPSISQLLLASGSSASVGSAVGPHGGGGSVGTSNGNGQFALTPDARACVTATYLCVLIVNNTWLDCNLLETLCNNNNNNNVLNNNNNNNNNRNDDDDERNKKFHDSDAQKRNQQLNDQHLLQLDALEFTLNELIAFAGGGSDDHSEEGGGGTGAEIGEQQEVKSESNENKQELENQYAAMRLINSNPPQQPIELHDKGGGGGGGNANVGERAGGGAGSENTGGYILIPQLTKEQQELLLNRFLLNSPRFQVTNDQLLLDRLKDIALSQQILRPLKGSTQENVEPPSIGSKSARLAEEPEEAYRLLEQYFSFAKLHGWQKTIKQKQKQQQKEKLKQQQLLPSPPPTQLYMDNSQLSSSSSNNNNRNNNDMNNNSSINDVKTVQDQDFNSAPMVTISTTLQPTEVTSSQNSLVSWVGRPFRGWNSYTFWSGGGGAGDSSSSSTVTPLTKTTQTSTKSPALASSTHTATTHDDQKDMNVKKVHLLRPIDRIEQYNDISTNQSLKEISSFSSQLQQLHQPFVTNQQRQYHLVDHQQNHPEKNSGLLTSESNTVLTATPNVQLILGSNKANNNIHSPVALFALSSADIIGPSLGSVAEPSHTNPSPTYGHLADESDTVNNQQQQQQTAQYLTAKTQLRPVTTPLSVSDVYGNPSTMMNAQRQQLLTGEDRGLSSILLHQQQQQQQQHQQQLQHQQQQHHFHQHLIQQQQQYQEQQVEPTTTNGVGVECKCSHDAGNDQIPIPLQPSLEDCRYHCTSGMHSSGESVQEQQLSSVGSGLTVDPAIQLTSPSSTTSPLATISSVGTLTPSSSSPASSMTLAPQQTTTSPTSGKMNPLDVTFLLYTRYLRDSSPKTSRTQTVVDGSGDIAGSLGAIVTSSSLVNAGKVIYLTNETTLSESHLNSSLPIKIIIHGFGSGGRRPWVTDMVYKLLDYEDVNVIVVDWEKGAALPNYVQAAGNTRLVGHKIASLIKSINAKYGLTGNTYHLIGFSLGAHVAGFAGMEIRNSTRSWINRITGLDPASPLFEGYEVNDRLDPGDAQFVDVIHSNGDGVLRGGFGSLQPMGHVDFYPNGGRVQVGCNSVLLSALSDIIYGKWQSLCNHRRALNFFMDSFESSKCKFRSFNCDSYESYLKGDCFDCGEYDEKCSNMGYLANYSKGRGKMYLTTHEDAPFCANQFMIKIIGTKGYKTHWGKVEVTLVSLDGKNESFWLSSINQQSNVHEGLNGNLKEHSQHSMQSLIVAHPTLVNFTQILLRYTKYKGWIYSGDESWSIDKVSITDSDRQVKSFCGFNTVLESHITTRLNLESGDCVIKEEQHTES